MGKFKKPKKTCIPKKDVFQRINYLYQAAHTVLNIPGNQELSQYYTNSLKSLASKNVTRLHPQIKRTICKGCNVLLLPGVTSKVRKRNKRQKHIVVSCLICGKIKRFISKSDYYLWNEQPENVSEMVSLKRPQPIEIAKNSVNNKDMLKKETGNKKKA